MQRVLLVGQIHHSVYLANITVRQKAAKEQGGEFGRLIQLTKLIAKDKEAAERAAREKAKADKLKMAEDRHKENVLALANLQKALVCDSRHEMGPY